MTLDKLREKRSHYETLKHEILNEDYSEELKLAVEEFVRKFKCKKDADKESDLIKVDHYLEIIDELILEELAKEEVNVESEDDINFTMEV